MRAVRASQAVAARRHDVRAGVGAKHREMARGAGDLQEGRAGVGRLGQPDTDLNALEAAGTDGGRSDGGSARRRAAASSSAMASRRTWSGRGHELDVADRVLSAPQRTRRRWPMPRRRSSAAARGSAPTSMTARPSGMRGTACRSAGSAAAIASSIGPVRPSTSRMAWSDTAAPRSAADVTPSAWCSAASCATVTAPDSNSHRRSAGRSASADSTQHPCRRLVHVAQALQDVGVGSRRADARADRRDSRRSRCRERAPAPRRG